MTKGLDENKLRADAKRVLRGYEKALQKEWKSLQHDIVNDITETVVDYARIRDVGKPFERAGNELLERFKKDADIRKLMHSYTVRSKEPLSLADKIQRKALPSEDQQPKQKPRFITTNECLYAKPKSGAFELFEDEKGATDLTGVRILHLYKPDWFEFHDFITKKISNEYGIIENTAYLSPHDFREFDKTRKAKRKELNIMGRKIKVASITGPATKDSEKFTIKIRGSGNSLDVMKALDNGYTSVHYSLERLNRRYAVKFVELQIRNLMEESWGEMQHQVNYPHSSSRRLTYQLGLLKHAADLCDDIARDVWEGKRSPALRWDQLAELAKSATKVCVATRTLKWTADQINKQPRKWAKNWTEACGQFIYYVEECPTVAGQTGAASQTGMTGPKRCGDKECEICPNVDTVQSKINQLRVGKDVSIKTRKSDELKNLISDRVYLQEAIDRGSDPKQYDVYVLADSRIQSRSGDGEADRVIRSGSTPKEIAKEKKRNREYRELARFFEDLQ